MVKFVKVGNFGFMASSSVYCASVGQRLKGTIIKAEKVLSEVSLSWVQIQIKVREYLWFDILNSCLIEDARNVKSIG